MTTVREIIDQLRVPTAGAGHKNVRSGWIGLPCPFCGSGGDKFHLGVHPETGAANCWKCGPKSLWQVVQAITGSKAEASALMAGVQFRRAPRDAPGKGPVRLPDGLSPLAPVHLAYLENRGLDGQQAASTWHAQGIGLAGRLAWRIWIPIELDGVVVSWTTRSVSPSNPRRYVSARPDEEAVPIKSLLYGEDYCRNAVIVHEGPLDVWRTGPGSVALFGLSYTPEQVAKISRYPVRAICLDSSDDAQRVARRLARDLAPFPGETAVVRLESGEDPGSASPEETAELRREFLEF
jgi:hypothetical protein